MGVRRVLPVFGFLIILLVSGFGVNSAFADPTGGDLIIADISSKAIFNQNPAGGVPSTIFSGAPYLGPFEITIDPVTLDIYVADFSAGTIFKQNPAGGAPTTVWTGAPYVNPSGITIEPASGHLIVTDQGANKVFRQNPAGGAPVTISSGAPYNGPTGVAIEKSSGDIIIANQFSNQILRQNPAGGAPNSIFVGAPYLFPSGVVIEPATDDILVVDANGIYRQNPAGGTPAAIHVGAPFNRPTGIDVHPISGDIFVADTESIIPGAGPAGIYRQNPAGGAPVSIFVGAPYIQPAGLIIFPQMNQDPITGIKIDIKPGSDPNAIQPFQMGVMPVVILSSSTFSAEIVDFTTITFGPDEATPVHKKPHFEDVNNDGLDDMVVHFKTKEIGIEQGTVELCLMAKTLDGTSIEGCDSIMVVPKT